MAILPAGDGDGTEHTQAQDHPDSRGFYDKSTGQCLYSHYADKTSQAQRGAVRNVAAAGLRALKLQCVKTYVNASPPVFCFLGELTELLGAHNTRVMCRFRKRRIGAVVQETISPTTIADEEQGRQEHQGTDRARLPLQEEAEQVEAHEHGVAEPQGGVEGLGDEEDGQQPLEAIHDLCWVGPLQGRWALLQEPT